MNISLERKPKEDKPETAEPMECCQDKYPVVYIRDIEGIEGLETGQEVTLKGKVSMVSERETVKEETCEVSIEVMELVSSGKAPKASVDEKAEDDEAVDKGIDEAIKKKSPKKEDDDMKEEE